MKVIFANYAFILSPEVSGLQLSPLAREEKRRIKMGAIVLLIGMMIFGIYFNTYIKNHPHYVK